jgi:ribosomal protein L12E/L44/L45/RPP1/RPP2
MAVLHDANSIGCKGGSNKNKKKKEEEKEEEEKEEEEKEEEEKEKKKSAPETCSDSLFVYVGSTADPTERNQYNGYVKL